MNNLPRYSLSTAGGGGWVDWSDTGFIGLKYHDDTTFRKTGGGMGPAEGLRNQRVGNCHRPSKGLLARRAEPGPQVRLVQPGLPAMAGISVDLIFDRSTSTPSTPGSGLGSAANGQITSAPIGWSLSPPNTAGHLWVSVATIQGNTVLSYSSPTRLTGDTGPRGECRPHGACGSRRHWHHA